MKTIERELYSKSEEYDQRDNNTGGRDINRQKREDKSMVSMISMDYDGDKRGPENQGVEEHNDSTLRTLRISTSLNND